MGEDFLKEGSGCSDKYKSGPYQRPVEGDTVAPWVKITFLKSNTSITVGNKSYNDGDNEALHTAAIVDFEFGAADGMTLNVIIHDQKGGNFSKFMDDLVKDSKCLSSPQDSIVMQSQWGWARTTCNGIAPHISSPEHHSVPLSVECNFSGGKFMFTITACDMGNRMIEGRTKAELGTDDNPMYLTDAIRKLFTESCGPIISNVEFRDKDGKEGIQWKTNDCGSDCKNGENKGPKGTWNPNNVDKLNYCCTEMLVKDNARTINDRMCIGHYDSTFPGGKIIIQESIIPNPGEDVEADARSIGTYIVNGGKFSPVIEFNPRIKWDFLALQQTGGQASNQQPLQNLDGGEAQGDPRSTTLKKGWVPCMGSEISSSTDRNTEDREGARAEMLTEEAATIHEHTLNLLHQPIEAELLIQGDPSLSTPVDFLYRTVSIVFVNPFHIFPVTGHCGDWLTTKPPCNEILSNKAWTIEHVSHKISPGRYTTTLRLFLAASGENIECYDPIGGVGSEGWQPTCC